MSRTPRNTGGMFGGASNFGIYDGMFTEIHGNYYANLSSQPHEAGLMALSQAILHGAIHDSAERYPAGKCHPGTREEIIKTILEWINDPNPASDALWLYGPAGAGKSAIMQTIAEILREWHKERYAGSFFFANGKLGRDQGSALFSTLAYQIAMYVPGMREAVNTAMAADVTLPTKSMNTQIKALIIEPFTRCYNRPTHHPTILVDGLDECEGSDTQRAILKLIANARTVSGVPLRFLIASRPEYWIRDTFDRQPLFDMTQRVDLSDSRQAYLDIRKYLEDGFAEIYDKNLDIMFGVQKPWPAANVIDRFVQDASGQFVYPSTVLKFVGTEFCDPRTQLRIISLPGPLRASAFSDLDQLYTKILSVYPRRESLIRVLGCLFYEMPLIEIEKGLQVEHGELNMVLRTISSLVTVTEISQDLWDEDLTKVYYPPYLYIKSYHRSFEEYLMDPDRSGVFVVESQLVEDEFFSYAFDLIIRSFCEACDYCNLPEVRHSDWMCLLCAISCQTSCRVIEHHFRDLKVAIQEFTTRKSGTIVHPKHLLCHMFYAMYVIRRLEQYRWDRSWNDLKRAIRTVQDECFRQILPSSSFLQFESAPYLMLKGTLDQISSWLGVSKEVGKSVLIENSCLIHVESGIEYPSFILEQDLKHFLNDVSRGGVFHIEFRKKFIRLSLQALAFLNTSQELQDSKMSPIKELPICRELITCFLELRGISDVKIIEDAEDGQNLQAFIDCFCFGDNWKHLLSTMVSNHYNTETIIIEWLHSQLNRQPSLPLLDNFKERMAQVIGEIYEFRILPKFTIPLFPDDIQHEETWLSSVTFPPPDPDPEKWLPAPEGVVPPFGIPLIQGIADYTWENGERSQKITKVLENAIYGPPIDRSRCYTHFLEYYLICYVVPCIHQCLTTGSSILFTHNENRRYRYISHWFLHAYPSTKILIGLWTIRYLCRRVKPIWYSPTAFSYGARGFLERHGLDPTGELHPWLEDLEETDDVETDGEE